MSGTAILGCGMAVPANRLANAELERRLDTSDEWIRQRTGIHERRIAEPDESTSTLAVRAGREAVQAAGLRPDDVDVVLVATCTPDYPIPGTSPLVQAGLGASRAGAFDLNAGCCGFVQALSVASALVASGQARHVLVCGADVLSRVTDPADRTTAVLFGDGAGAVVVGPSAHPRIGPFEAGCDGTKADWLLVPAGGSRRPADSATVAERAHSIRMRGQDVYKQATDAMTECARRLIGEGASAEVDLIVAHQANARIIETVRRRLGVPADRIPMNIDRYGNTSAASIPIVLAECVRDGRLRDGMRVLLLAFGAGFTWAGGWIVWGAG